MYLVKTFLFFKEKFEYMKKDYLYSLRSFLEILEIKKQLVKVKRRVNLNYELAGVLLKSMKIGGPALIFENTGKGMPVVGGIFGTQYRLGLALGFSSAKDKLDGNLTLINGKNFLTKIIEKIQKAIFKPTPYKKVRSGPVEEIIEKRVDLSKFPVPKWFEHDGGPYITGGVTITRNPITSTLNMGIYRIQVLGRDKLTLYAAPGHDLHRIIETAEERSENIEIAIAIGVDPPTFIAASLSIPQQLSELDVAGSLRGAPLEVIPCKTTDLVVPANAEIVIEGILDPKKRIKEGPFGEYDGFYAESFSPLIKVKTIYHREKPIFHVCLPGPKPGHEGFIHLFRGILARKIFETLKMSYPNIKSLAFSGYGSSDHLIIAVDKKSEDEPANIIRDVFGMRIDETPVALKVKRVTVIDADEICSHDLEEVEFALNSYLQNESSIIIVPDIQSILSSYEDNPSIRIGIDATKPSIIRAKKKRARIPRLNEINLWSILFS